MFHLHYFEIDDNLSIYLAISDDINYYKLSIENKEPWKEINDINIFGNFTTLNNYKHINAFNSIEEIAAYIEFEKLMNED